MKIKIGTKLTLPVYMEGPREMMEGTCIYIHPKKRFVRFEFITPVGKKIRESYHVVGGKIC